MDMKNAPLRIIRPVLLLACLFLFSSCTLFDSISTLFVTEQDEVKLGTEFDQQLHDSTRTFPVYNPGNSAAKLAFQNYVTHLAASVLAGIPAGKKPGYPFKFTLIDQDIDNAFAVPGGFVYIYTGIIKHMQNESELAGVLGHEIAHVTQHHYRDAMVKQQGLSLLVQALVGDDAGKITELVASSFVQLTSLQISQGNESDADAYGTRYEAAIGRNPMGIANFFSRMQDQGIAILSTHPQPSSRVADVTAEVNGDATLQALAADSLNTNYKSRFEQYVGPIR